MYLQYTSVYSLQCTCNIWQWTLYLQWDHQDLFQVRAACEGLGAEYLVVKEEGAGRVLHLDQLVVEGQGCSEEVWLHLHWQLYSY